MSKRASAEDIITKAETVVVVLMSLVFRMLFVVVVVFMFFFRMLVAMVVRVRDGFAAAQPVTGRPAS